MQKRKHGVAMMALALSATVFVSTAVADVMLGSGYEGVKDSLKKTALQTEKELNNYTIEALFTIKDNGTKLGEFSGVTKIDNINKINENVGKEDFPQAVNMSIYRYLDATQSITKNSGSDVYYISAVDQKQFDRERMKPPNPFNHENAADIERIFDAAVGSMKDIVQVKETENGGKNYLGSIEEIQVPALINAIASFGLKQATTSMNRSGHNEMSMPVIVSDIYIKKVSGNVMADKTGLVNSLVGEVVFSGVDKQEKHHEMSIGGMFIIKDINTTVIKKPNLEGKQVEKVSRNGNGLDERYVGVYKNNIVVEKERKFIKVGERVLTITSVNDQKLVGHFVENYGAGFEEYAKERMDFSIEMGLEDDAQFTYRNAKGEEEYGRIMPGGDGKVHINLFEDRVVKDENGTSYSNHPRSDSEQRFDGQMMRVFEK